MAKHMKKSVNTNTVKAKMIIVFVAIILLTILTFVQTTMAKYVLKKDVVVNIKTASYYFTVQAEQTEYISKSGINIKLKAINYKENSYMNIDVGYKIEAENNNYNITIQDTGNGKLTGGSKQENEIVINAIPKDGINLNELEIIKLTITTSKPYVETKEMEIKIDTRTRYQVIYNMNADGTENNIEPQTKIENEDLELSNEIPTRVGYTFKGWASTKDATNAEYVMGANNKIQPLYTNNEDVTLYAVWEANEYNVIYEYNNATGENTESNKRVVYDSQYGELVKPTREYTVSFNTNGGNKLSDQKVTHVFEGWYKESSLVNRITEETIVTTASNHTIYAKWTMESIRLPEVEKTGYTFKGWYEDSGLTGISYESGVSYIPTKNITLNAKWQINSSKLIVNPNGGSVSIISSTDEKETIITDSKTYTQEYNTSLIYGMPEKENSVLNTTYTVTYNYDGATENNTIISSNAVKTDTIAYQFSSWIKSDKFYGTLSSTIGDGIYTYGVTNDVTSTITASYISNTISSITEDIELPIPVKTGYIFKGWYDNSELIGTAYTSTYTPTSNIILYAKWEAKTIKVTFMRNISSTDTVNDVQTFTYGTSNQKFSAKGWNKIGYTANGWHSDKNSMVSSYLLESNVADEWINDKSPSITLYVVWKANEYDVTYEYNNATGENTESNKRVVYDSPYGELVKPTREYTVSFNTNGGNKLSDQKVTHVFEGWYKESSLVNRITEETIVTTASNHTIYAKWTMGSVRLPEATRIGYTFEGWYEDSALTGTAYESGGAYIPTKNTIFNAKWKVNEYTVTYDYSTNGGDSSTKENAKVEYDSYIDLTVSATKSGYNFIGWNTNKDATTALTSLKMEASNVTIYAIYGKELSAVFNYYNEKIITVKATAYNKETSAQISAPGALGIPSGYTFRGWSKLNTANAKIDLTATGAVELSSNAIYYASYEQKVTATYYYNSGNTSEGWASTTQSSATASGIRYMQYNGTILDSAITIPEAVTSNSGCMNTKYKGISTSTSSDTLVISTTANTIYYACYEADFTYYYYDGSAQVTLPAKRYNRSNGSKYVCTVSATPTPSAYDGATFKGWVISATSLKLSDGTSSIRYPNSTGLANVYAYYQKNITATFNYYNGTVKASTTASAIKTYISATNGVNVINNDIVVPDVVKSNVTLNGLTYTYRGISLSNAYNATPTIPTTATENGVYYASYQVSIEATYYYNSGNTSSSYGYTTQSSATASGIRYMQYNGTITNSAITIPEVVTSTLGYTNTKYKGISTLVNSGTLISSTTANTTYYACYEADFTYYYYNGSGQVTMAAKRYNRSNGNKYVCTVSATPTPSEYDGAAFKGWTIINNSLLEKDGTTAIRTPIGTGVANLYAYYQKNTTATFWYYNGSTKTSATASAIKTYISKSGGVNIVNNSITVPSAVATNRTINGITYIYLGVSTSATSNTTVTPTTANVTYYAVYSTTVTFYSGSNKATTTNATQYYNSNGTYSVVAPTPTAISGWTALGWRGDTTAGAKVYNAGATITASTTAYYAVYSRAVTFYSGTSKATTTSATQYYNSNGAYSVVAPTPTAISGWTALGWRGDTTAGAKSYDAGATITASTTAYYAVYSRTVTFYSGSNNGTQRTSTQYYNSNGANVIYVLAPTAISGWTTLGWRGDTTAGAKVYGTASTGNISGGSSTKYYAVYSRTVTFYSGTSKATTTSATQYYNSNGAYSVVAPTPTAISGWTKLGWRGDTTAGAKVYNAGATITASTTAYYAVYSRTVTFYSGTSKATTKTTATQYYNSNGAYSVVAPTPTAISGWTTLGWRGDTTAGVKSYNSGATITATTTTYYAVYSRVVTFYSGANNATTTKSTQYYNSNGANSMSAPAPTAISGWTTLGWRGDTTAGAKVYGTASTGNISGGSSTKYYAVYSRTVTFYSGTSKATTTSATQYYNSNGAYSVVAPTPTAISGWTKLGWRGDTTAGAKVYNAGATITASTTAYYAVYSRTVTLAYNGNGSTSGSVANQTATQYYNSNGTITSPSFTLRANGFTKTGYTFTKWAAGSTSGTQYVAGATYTFAPAVGTTTVTRTMYAIWSSNSTIAFTRGTMSGGATVSVSSNSIIIKCTSASNSFNISSENVPAGYKLTYSVQFNNTGGGALNIASNGTLLVNASISNSNQPSGTVTTNAGKLEISGGGGGPSSINVTITITITNANGSAVPLSIS